MFYEQLSQNRGLPESQIMRISFFPPGISSGDYKIERKKPQNKKQTTPNNPPPKTKTLPHREKFQRMYKALANTLLIYSEGRILFVSSDGKILPSEKRLGRQHQDRTFKFFYAV